MFMRGSVAIAAVILMSGINAEVPSAGLCGPGTVLDGGLVSFFAFLKKNLSLPCAKFFFTRKSNVAVYAMLFSFHSF